MMKKQPDILQLAATLHIDSKRIKAYQRYWLIDGDREKWVAKPVEDWQQLHWWKQIERQLLMRGYTSLAKTKQVGNWLLSVFIEGKPASYRKRTLTPLLQTLATFHHAGKQLLTPPLSQAAYLLPHRLYSRLMRFSYHLRRKTAKDPRLIELLENYGWRMYQHGYEVYQKLYRLGFCEAAFAAREQRMLCHRDLANHNWIIDHSGCPWLIDFETVDYDLQIGDLWQLCSRIMTEHHWDLSFLQQLLHAYTAIRPLSHWEWRVFALLCAFPNEFMREAIGLLEQKEGYKAAHILPYLERIIADYPNWVEQVKRIDELLHTDAFSSPE
jgi:thiamine kinase-like enzyme